VLGSPPAAPLTRPIFHNLEVHHPPSFFAPIVDVAISPLVQGR